MVALFHLDRSSLGHRLIHILGTFLLVDLSWIFFRADGIRQALAIIRGILTVHDPWILFDGSLYECGLDSKNLWLLLICIGILFFADCCRYKKIQVRDVLMRQDYWFQCLFIVFAVSAVLIFGIWGPSYDAANFIYFQF